MQAGIIQVAKGATRVNSAIFHGIEVPAWKMRSVCNKLSATAVEHAVRGRRAHVVRSRCALTVCDTVEAPGFQPGEN